MRKFDITHLVTVIPLADASHRLGLAGATNAVLESAGWSARTDDRWLALERQNVPLFAIHQGLPSVAELEAAHQHAYLLGLLFCDLLALHRGAHATPLLTAVEHVASVVRPRPHVVRSHTPPYRGNLLGGVISGEDPGDPERSQRRCEGPAVPPVAAARS